MTTNAGDTDSFLKELKHHFDALDIKSQDELSSIRLIWRNRFKYLSSLEWQSKDELSDALQKIEKSYRYLEDIDFEQIKELISLHENFLFSTTEKSTINFGSNRRNYQTQQF